MVNTDPQNLDFYNYFQNILTMMTYLANLQTSLVSTTPFFMESQPLVILTSLKAKALRSAHSKKSFCIFSSKIFLLSSVLYNNKRIWSIREHEMGPGRVDCMTV